MIAIIATVLASAKRRLVFSIGKLIEDDILSSALRSTSKMVGRNSVLGSMDTKCYPGSVYATGSDDWIKTFHGYEDTN